jgi:hypothetical protein
MVEEPMVPLQEVTERLILATAVTAVMVLVVQADQVLSSLGTQFKGSGSNGTFCKNRK